MERQLKNQTRLQLSLAIVCIAVAAAFSFYAWKVTRIGLDLRHDLWTVAREGRYDGDINSGMQTANDLLSHARRAAGNQRRPPSIAHPGPGLFDPPLTFANVRQRFTRLRPLYGQIFHAWVAYYDQLQLTRTNGDYEMDYPPMRLLVMTLWTWNVQSHFPHVASLPEQPSHVIDGVTGARAILNDSVAAPILAFNTFCSGVAAVATFFLVWVWVQRDRPADMTFSWHDRWGSRLLLAPTIALAVFTLLSFVSHWQLAGNNSTSMPPIDQRVSSIPWLIALTLRFLAVVALARFLPHPFRGPACGLVAATLAWLNPPLMLDSHVWPQWDSWLLPFFFLAALAASVDYWLIAGLIIGFGCTFKGQLLFGVPVLFLCPLFAGQPIRFVKILIGFAGGLALVIWPWLLAGANADRFLLLMLIAAFLAGGLSFFSETINQKMGQRYGWILALSVAAFLTLCVQFTLIHSLIWSTAFPILAALALAWAIPRRSIATWLFGIATGTTWLAAFVLGGSFSWFTVGYAYGTTRHDQEMQLSNRLSNLAAILDMRYGWHVHSPVGTISIPLLHVSMDVDLRQVLGIAYLVAIILCGIGAALHWRRRDPRFLIALAAPWMIFPALLPQMSARYFIFPAVASVLLVGVSTRWSLLHLLATAMACTTLFMRMWSQQPKIAPLTYSILDGTHPDMGWAMLLMAALFLVGAVTPSRRSG